MLAALPDQIAAVRRFNRFYTRRIGVLDATYLGTPYASRAEGRALYEIGHDEGITPKALAERAALDPGYLSRILKRFDREGLLLRVRSETDGRSALQPALRPSWAGACSPTCSSGRTDRPKA